MTIGIPRNLPSIKTPFGNNISRSHRYHSVDISRGFAVTLMIQAHLILFIAYSGSLTIIASLFSPAPFFLIIAGLSFDLLYQSRQNKKISENLIYVEVVTRAAVLVFIDIALLFLGSFFLPSLYTFKIYWGVFQVIAAGYIIGLFIPKKFLSLSISILILCFLKIVFGFYNNDLFSGLSSELIPMLIYFQLGRGLFYLYNKNNYLNFQKIRILFVLLVFSITFSFFLFVNFQIKISEIFPNRYSLLMITFIFSNVITLIIILKILEEKFSFLLFLLKPFERVGKIAFTIYILNIIIIYCLILLTTTLFPTISIPIHSQLLYLLCFFTMIYLLSVFEKYWGQWNYFLGFEWILRNCSNFVVKYFINYI